VAIPRPPEAKWERVKGKRLAHDPTTTTSPPLPVNAWVNRTITYAADLVDRWQMPGETLKRGRGDCEDLAILKRAILINRGWPAELLPLLIVRELATGAEHAVLWVAGDILDIGTDASIKPAQLVGLVTPVFAFGAEQAWLYGQRAS
jgi:predicted transglutaminase-like cysteine proteinase